MNARRYVTRRETVTTVTPLNAGHAPAPMPAQRRPGRPRKHTPADVPVFRAAAPASDASPARLDILAPGDVAGHEIVLVDGFMPAALARQLAALVAHHNAG